MMTNGQIIFISVIKNNYKINNYKVICKHDMQKKNNMNSILGQSSENTGY